MSGQTVGEVNITKAVFGAIHNLHPGFIKICHFNAQSMCARKNLKMDEIRNLFIDSQFDVIAVSETWLKSCVTNKSVEIAGFKLFRNDRPKRTGGGVAIYVRKHLKCFLLGKSVMGTEIGCTRSDSSGSWEFVTRGLEFLLLEIFLNNRKLFFGVCYNPNPSRIDNRENLTLVFDNILSRYEDIVLTGDFNTNVLVPVPKTVDFLDLLNEYGLINYSTVPTHFSHVSSDATCIDLLITNRRNGIVQFSQIDVPGFSRHDLIFFSYDIPTVPIDLESFLFRDYKNAELTTAGDYLIYFLSNFTDIANVETMIEYFNYTLRNCFELCVPLKQIYPKTVSHPWFTKEINDMINLRDRAYKIWKRTRTSASWESYKSLRNTVNSLCRSKKMLYLRSHISPQMNSKTMWKRIKDLGVANQGQSHIAYNVNEINTAFNDNASFAASESELNTLNVNNYWQESSYEFSFRCVSQIEVIKAISSIKSNAIGNDEIPIKFIKLMLPWIASKITCMFNKIITSSTYPLMWKISKIIPIPKTASIRSIKDLRPVSILPSLSKALEKILCSQITEYLETRGLMSVHQYGFRKNMGTETALLNVSDQIFRLLDEKKMAVLVLLDFSKAFDLVNHSLLLEKMRYKFGFSRSSLSLVESYLSDRAQYVVYQNEVSDPLLSVCGVPQGSILGPLFFTLFINDLPAVLQHTSCQLYADDVQIFCGDKTYNMDRMIDNCNDDLKRVHEWTLRNKLILNAKKTQSMLFGNNSEHSQHRVPRIVIDNTAIEYNKECKNLGVIIDRQLNWKSNIQHICGKIYNGLRSLRNTASYMNQSMRKMLVKSLIIPHIIYCSSVMGRLSRGSFDTLKRAYNSCLRFVYEVGRYESVSRFSFDLLGCSLETFLKYRIYLRIFNIISNKIPISLFEQYQPGNSRRVNNYVVPRNRTELRNKSFLVYSISLFNAIPNDIKNLNFKQFKTQILQHLNSL